MVAEDPPRGALDLELELGVPPDVVGIDHHPDLRGIEALGQIERLRQRDHHRALGDHHRVQRLDPQPHAVLDGVGKQESRCPRAPGAALPRGRRRAPVRTPARARRCRARRPARRRVRLSLSRSARAAPRRRGEAAAAQAGHRSPASRIRLLGARRQLCGATHRTSGCPLPRTPRRPRPGSGRSAVIGLKLSLDVDSSERSSRTDSADREQAPHAFGRQRGIGQQTGAIGEPEDVGQVHAACARPPGRRPCWKWPWWPLSQSRGTRCPPCSRRVGAAKSLRASGNVGVQQSSRNHRRRRRRAPPGRGAAAEGDRVEDAQQRVAVRVARSATGS